MEREAIQTEADLASAERMEDADMKKAPRSAACQKERQMNFGEAQESMRSSLLSNDGDALRLQWGRGKRPRCSRFGIHISNGLVKGDYSLKLGYNLAGESSLLCKRVCTVRLNMSSLAFKGISKAANGVAAKRDHLLAEGKRNQQTKVMIKELPSNDRHQLRESSPRGAKAPCSPHPEQIHSLQQSIRHVVPFQNLLPQDERAAALVAVSNGVGLSNDRVSWPKLVIALSRKEKGEDFLIFKGNKLLQKSKRRLKVVQKALHSCTPGRWLVDILESRYHILREKKRVKKEPRGLKAMASLDSDSI